MCLNISYLDISAEQSLVIQFGFWIKNQNLRNIGNFVLSNICDDLIFIDKSVFIRIILKRQNIQLICPGFALLPLPDAIERCQLVWSAELGS